jgi:tetratricopeptide (TPR) repeat protein
MRSKCLAALLLSALLAAAGCHKRTPVVASAPPPPPPPAPAPAPAPPPPAVTVSPLDQADRAFASGNYDEAAREYENYLRATNSGGERDDALFHLALTYALRPAPGTDWPRAIATLKQLVEEYPDSAFKSQANLILSLRAELDQVAADSKQRDLRIKQLTTELDRLKKIDADRRKRP